MTMKSIVVAHITLLAVCAWAELSSSVQQAQIVRPPIKYWIETVEFIRNVTEVSATRNEITSDASSERANDETQMNENSSMSKKEVHANGEASGGVSATRSGGKPIGEIKINAGGGVSKEWIKKERTERRKRQFVSNTDIEKQVKTSKTTAGNWTLSITICIQNISTNVTYVYDSVENGDSGLHVRSLVKSNPLWISLPLKEKIELRPNGGYVTRTVDIDIQNPNHKGLLSEWSERGVLKECLTLAPDGQFCLKDKSDNHYDWCPSNMRNSVVVNVDVDDPRFFNGMFPIVVSGKGLTCKEVLDAVSSQLMDDDKFHFNDNGGLCSGLGLVLGTFTNDENGVYAVMAELNGTPRSCLAKDERLNSHYDNWKSELRFIKIGTDELLSGYQKNPANYPKAEILDCLSHIMTSQACPSAASDRDLCNGAELAKAIGEYGIYARLLVSMSYKSRIEYLKSNEDKQSAMELAIVADNEEYFKKLRSLGWGNTNRTVLGFAAEKGSLNIVRLLLEDAPEYEQVKVDGLVDGAGKDDIGERGKTPLFWAAQNGHLDVCQYLASKGADINRWFFEKEMKSQKNRKYDELVSAKSIPDVRIRNYIKSQREVLEIEHSWWRSRKPKVSVDTMRRWVDDGVLPNSYLGFHWNLLSWAVELKDVALVKSLIDKGADVNGKYSATPNERRTALMLACEVGDTNLVGKLISKGADLYAHQDDGMNAFYYAIKYGKYDCAKMLLDKLDVEKCSQVEDGGLKLTLRDYVGKYCKDKDFYKDFCEKVKGRE